MQGQRPDPPEGGAKLQIREYKESLIIDAAANLFYERGFQRTTLDDIGAALGVTKPFIYTYFKSKYNILERLFDKVYDDLYESVTEFQNNPDPDPVRRFEHFVSAYIRKNLERRSFSAIMLEEEKNLSPEKIAGIRSKQHGFDRLLTSLVLDGVRAGVFRVDDATLASLAISGMVRWTHRWYSPQGRLSADEIVEHFTRLALRIVGWTGTHAPEAAPTRTKRGSGLEKAAG